MIDVLFIKVREDKRVVSKAFHVILGINNLAERELLTFSISDSESYESWKSVYTGLKERSLEGLKLVISDAHNGEIRAIKECFPGVAWQRCQVHFMRNFFDKLPKKSTQMVRDELKVCLRQQTLKLHVE